MTQILDYSFARPGAQAIRDANYGGVIRYLAPRPNEKVWGRAELDEHRGVGLWCGFVWETTTGRPLQGRDAGVTDAQRANAMCDEMDVPASVAVYYACDRADLTPDQVRDYFEGVLSVGGRPAGVYGSREVVEAMMDLGVTYGWQVETWTRLWHRADGSLVDVTTEGFAQAERPLVSPRAAIVQLPNVRPRVGGTDANDVRTEDWGGWAPVDGVQPAPIAASVPAPPVGAANDWPTLVRGMSGSAVQEMQQVMANRGWNLDPDGDFGEITEAKVVAFQREHGLDTDGVVGPITKDALLNAPGAIDGTPGAGDVVPVLPTMRRGDSGPDVATLQARLAVLGYSIGVDGQFGRQTDTMVRDAQATLGLEVDGIAGPLTITALWTAASVPTPPPPAPPVEPPPPAPTPGIPGELHPDPAGQIAAWGFYGVDGAVAMFQQSFAFWQVAVDGDPGPETARAVQEVVDNGGYLSPHFSIDEWKCRHCGRIKAHRVTFEALEREREMVGPIPIVSGHRCDEHNAAIGGATDSQHRFGTAGDKNTLVSSSERAGFTGIGTCGDECLHGDCGHVGEHPTRTEGQPTFWSYC